MRVKIHTFIHRTLKRIEASYGHLHRKIAHVLRWLKRHTRRLTPAHVFAAIIAGLIVFIVASLAIFLWPRSVSFSYANNNCYVNPLFLPKLASTQKKADYSVTPVASISVAGYPLYSRTTCIAPTQPPQENSNEVINFKMGPLTKKITVKTAKYPTLASQSALDKPIPTQDPLVIKLSNPDRIFEYHLLANDKKIVCSKDKDSVACDVTQLGLTQSKQYSFTLKRVFQGEVAGTVFERSLTTVESVHIVSSSITPGQTVFDAPDTFTISLNRPVTTIEGAKLYVTNGDKREEVEATSTLKDTIITVRPKGPFARSSSFVFTVDKITAADGGFLTTPYSLPFKMSGGPKVVKASIGSYKVSLTGAITLTFDSVLSATQAAQNFARLEINGAAVASSITASANTITLRPNAALPRCSALTVKVLDGLQNAYGITGGTAWQYKSRTICQSVSSIGTSVQGRAITAYSFGSGPSRVVMVGALHGDEKSSSYILNSMVEDLEANPNIPANRTVVIIPVANPDGLAMGRRTNANNVDLNRNFPTNNWKSSVVMPDKSTNPMGGGPAPLSEPESRAIANYAQGARLVLTYHAIAGTVIPNDAGDSVGLARLYDQKSNVYFASNSQTTSIFAYDTTGSLEDWLYDKIGVPALLVELWTRSDNEFGKHQQAMRAMVGL